MRAGAESWDLDSLWSAFDPIDLDELLVVADLQTRRDRKYLVPLDEMANALDLAVPGARILTIDERRSFCYRSTYFDTIGLECYLGAAHRRPTRFKVRTRHYVDTGTDMLEVKTRNRRGLTVKRRRPCRPGEAVALSCDGRAFVDDCLAERRPAQHLSPSLTTSYHRTTLHLPGDGARITIDVDLAWDSTDGRHLDLGPLALIETKTDGRSCAVDRLLWALGRRPVTISKYCTGLAALHPHLPANKWNRTLRHHLDWEPVEVSATWPRAEPWRMPPHSCRAG